MVALREVVGMARHAIPETCRPARATPGTFLKVDLIRGAIGGSPEAGEHVSTAPQSPVEKACIVVAPDDAPARLAELGLRLEFLTSSVAVGDSRRKEKVSPQYPRNYPSIVAWAETIGELRRQLIRLQEGWASSGFGNYETVYLTARGIAIAVVGGNKFTGTDNGYHPRLARRRGPMTAVRVRRNANFEQFTLALGDAIEKAAESKTKAAADANCLTWFLVVYADADEIRIELSLPSGIGKDGVVHKWTERIILPSLPISGAVLPIDPYQDSDDDDDPLVTRN
ncbi:hypothetical protein ACVGOW_03520 [Pseudonocardia saturnea]